MGWHDLLDFEPHTGDISMDKVTNAFFGEAGVVCLWGLFGKVTCYDLYSIDKSIFNSFETTATCVNDWAATSEIYIESRSPIIGLRWALFSQWLFILVTAFILCALPVPR